VAVTVTSDETGVAGKGI